MDIQVGEHANDYQEIAAKDKLTELQLRIRQLLDQVEQISKEQNYQRVSKEITLESVIITKFGFVTVKPHVLLMVTLQTSETR